MHLTLIKCFHLYVTKCKRKPLTTSKCRFLQNSCQGVFHHLLSTSWHVLLFVFNMITSSQAATEQNETSSKTKIIKYIRIALKDCLKTADARKFRVNAALLHLEVTPIAPVYCRGPPTARTQMRERKPQNSGLSQAFGWQNEKFPNFLGLRTGRKRKMMALAVLKAEQKRKADETPGTVCWLGVEIPGGILSTYFSKYPLVKHSPPSPSKPTVCSLNVFRLHFNGSET